MPKVKTAVARKDSPKACPQAKKGDTYYYWRTRLKGQRSGVTRCSMRRPRPSQLTRSEYLGEVYELREEIEDAMGEFTDPDDLAAARDEWAQRARDIAEAQDEKLNNMPDGLRQGDSGMLLEERRDVMESWAGDIESMELPDCDDLDEDDCRQAIDDTIGEMAAACQE